MYWQLSKNLFIILNLRDFYDEWVLWKVMKNNQKRKTIGLRDFRLKKVPSANWDFWHNSFHFYFSGNACKHGVCQSPNFCACEVGWEGACCETCLLLPGCVHGNCTTEFECNCHPGWTGAYCDIRKLKIKDGCLMKPFFIGLGVCLEKTIGHINYRAFGGIFGQTISSHFGTVSSLSMFSIIQPLLLQKTKSLYPHPKYLFGLGFEFECGLQRIRDLAYLITVTFWEKVDFLIINTH